MFTKKTALIAGGILLVGAILLMIPYEDASETKLVGYEDCKKAGGEIHGDRCYMSEDDYYVKGEDPKPLKDLSQSGQTESLGEVLGNNTTFIWADLSTFKVSETKDFYSDIFGWNYYGVDDQSMDNEYFTALKGNKPVSAVFTMPEYLQKLKLPSFWMSYIHVENLDKVVERARDIPGVIVEVEPVAFNEESRIALLRDPAGAGFTVYEGPKLEGRDTSGTHGKLMWNVHHVEDLDSIRPFYEQLFSWKFQKVIGSDYKYEIYNPQNTLIAHVEVLPKTLKGTFQYWIPIFAIDNLEQSLKTVKASGGKQIADMRDGRRIIQDSQGGRLMIAEDVDTTPTNPPKKDDGTDTAVVPTNPVTNKPKPSRNSAAS